MELTLRRQKTLFFPFMFQGPKRRQKNMEKIQRSLFWKEEDVGAKESSKRSPQGKKGWPTRPGTVAAWGQLVWASWLRCRRSFVHRLRLDLETPIKKVPRRSPEGAPHKQRNTETEIRSCRLEGETPAGRCRGGFHLLQRLLHRLHDEGGVVRPLDLGLWW